MILVTVRWASVAVALYLFSRKQIAADWPLMRQRLGYLLGMGALGFTVFSVSLFYALVYTTAINSSILQGGMPLFVFCASFFLFSSRIVKEQALGFFISFIGVLVVAVQGDFGNLLGEAFHRYHAVALTLVLVGIGLAEYGGRKLGSKG